MKKHFPLSFLCFLSFAAYSQTFNSTTTGTVPDNQCPLMTDFPIVVTGVGTIGGANSFAQIEINIDMKSVGDLDIYLVAPNGTTVVPLSIGEGGAGDNFTHTVFRSDGTMTLKQGAAPFTGNFFPDGDLIVLNGIAADGTWKIRICDLGPGDTATFVSASLTFSSTIAVTCSAPIYVTAASGGVGADSVHFIWSGGGSLNYFYVLDESPANPTVSGTATTAISYDATGLKPETNYYLHVRNDCGSYNGFSSWSKAIVTTPPVNSGCANALNIATLPFNKTQNILGSNYNDGFVAACGDGMNDGAWYTFNIVTGGDLKLDLSNINGWNPEIAVFKGSCDALTCVGSADVAGSGGAESLSLTALTPGQYWVSIGDGSGTVDNPEGNFTIDISGTVAMAALSAESFGKPAFSYYPNPIKNKLNLSYNKSISELRVYNFLGQQVMEKVINANSSEVDMSVLSSGSYVVKVMTEGQIQSIRIIKE